MTLRTRIVETIHAVDSGAWNALAGPDDFYVSHGWLAAIERDRVATARYLLALDGDRLVGALPMYHLLDENGMYYQVARFRTLLGLTGDYLVGGGRSGNRGAVLLATDQETTILDTLMARAVAHAAELGYAGIVLPYLSTPTLRRLGTAVRAVAALDDAEAVLPEVGDGLVGYLSRLPKRRRYNARKEMAVYAGAGWRTGRERLTDCLADVARLVSLVNERHGAATPDYLLRRILRWEDKAVGDLAVVLTCRDEDDRLAACAVNFAWRDTLYLQAIGLDYSLLRNSFEYFNLMVYAAIAYAAEHGLNRLHLGLATTAKTLRGAAPLPLWTAGVVADEATHGRGVELVGEPDRKGFDAILQSP